MDVGLDIINKQIPKADTELISITINDHFITLKFVKYTSAITPQSGYRR